MATFRLIRIVCIVLFAQHSFSLRISPVLITDQKRIKFFATTAFGLERTLANEVRRLSGVDHLSEGKGSVSFQGTVHTGLEALLWLRTPLKLMEQISTSNSIKSKNALYDWIASHDWQSMIESSQTLKCDTILGQDICSELNHSHFTALTIKNAIVDQLRSSNTAGMRPSVDIEDPDMPLSLYLHRAKGTLYRVWSGEKSMHKRGYRPDMVHKAALRETTAAALLLNTEWPSLCESILEGGASPVFCDPMCGSGTFAVEAALLAADTAPGLVRYVSPEEASPGGKVSVRSDDRETAPLRPNPLRWPDLADMAAPVWQALWNEASHRDRRASLKGSNVPAFILGNDIHGGAVNLARQAATKAGVQHLTHFSVTDIAQYKPARPVGLFVTNPPWGGRLDGAEDAAAKLDAFAHRMSGKGGAAGTPMWVLSGGGGETDGRGRGRSQWDEQSMVPYLPGRPAATMRLRVAATDMMFAEHLL